MSNLGKYVYTNAKDFDTNELTKDIKVGDKLIGIASSGLHSNGYSLVRKLFTDLKEDIGGKEAWETLITPTKIYVKPITFVFSYIISYDISEINTLFS